MSEMSDIAKGEDTPTVNHLLTNCQLAYAAAKTWYEQSGQQRARDSYDRFYSRHPADSKYHKDAFAKRSRMFRPKTRVAVRNLETQASIAAFSTKDFTNCIPVNKKSKRNQQAAELHQALLNSRLGGATHTKTSIPWYRIYIGAIQELAVQGVVVSKQQWEFEEYRETTTTTFQDPETGELTEREENKDIVKVDRPRVDLIPLERFRLDPAADWTDPIGTAKFMVHEIPMYREDIEARMKLKGARAWKAVPLSPSNDTENSTLERARDPEGQERTTLNDGLGPYEIMWVHEHIRSTPDGDMVVYLLDNKTLLSDEIPLEEIYPVGRPFVLGQIQVEAHRIYTSSIPEVASQTQDEVNNVANLRLDNLTLSMLGRYFFKRGGGVDIRTLMNGGPGSAVGMSTLDSVKWDRPADVTNSAYEEQDRLSVDFDDAAGVMSQSSVMSSKQLNETVGGMAMLTSTAHATQEYFIRTGTETWCKLVLQQLVELQSFSESDEELVLQAAEAVGMDVSKGSDEAFELLQYPVIATPDVGFGATSPDKRIGRITMALDTLTKYMPSMMQAIDGKEVSKEVFGAVGHDSERFFPTDKEQDPKVAELEAKVQELTKIIETKQVEVDGRIQVASITADAGLKKEEMRLKAEDVYKKATLDLESRKRDIDQMIATATNDARTGELILQREALNKSIMDTEREFLLQLYQLGLAPDIGLPPTQSTVEGSAGPVPVDGKAAPPDMPGNDKGGTLARDNYGDVPFAAQ